MEEKEKFMKIALIEARKAYKKKEVPVGCVITKDGKVIAKSHNLRETKKLSIAHAEILCIKKACRKIDSWRLDGCHMYVTLEPCPMCAGGIIQSRIEKVYIGAMDEKNGMVGSVTNIFDLKTTHKVEYETGILKKECSKILTDFFKDLRKNKNK